MVRHKFKVTTHELHWNLDADKVVRPDHWPDAFAPYLRSDQSVVVNDNLRKVTERGRAGCRTARRRT